MGLDPGIPQGRRVTMRATRMRTRLRVLVSLALATAGLLAAFAAPPATMAACHASAWNDSLRSGTLPLAGSGPGSRTTASMSVRWRYLQDCSYAITGVQVDSRSVKVLVDGADAYICCYQRWVQTMHLRYPSGSGVAWDNFYPGQKCAAAVCNFPWKADGGDVSFGYSPSAWNVDKSPVVRTVCENCTPSGLGADVYIEFFFIHNQFHVASDPWTSHP
jgi:hypothetical protein